MKILWLDINSSYSHSSMALPAIHARIMDRDDIRWKAVSGTVNDSPGKLASEVVGYGPDIIAATWWLFTHEILVAVLSRCKAMLPEVVIVGGGPEFAGNNRLFLERNTFMDAVFRGEGEESVPEWLSVWNSKEHWKDISGLCYIDDDGLYHDNGIAKVMEYSKLPYPESSPFFRWNSPFVQIETSRGCFNSCAFCVSGGDRPVRCLEPETLYERLANVRRHGVRDVRILDRTFNYDIDRACTMLDVFREFHPDLRFHLEIHPALLDGRLRNKIASMPAGMLHLEAGIQSLDSEVLRKSCRKGSLKASLEGLEYLSALDNVAVHADLIAGLPGYSFEMLYEDVLRLLKIGADEIQLELLKVLPGTGMRNKASEYGIVYSPVPQYEVLRTGSIEPEELLMAGYMSRVVDLYYNYSFFKDVFASLAVENHGFLYEFTDFLRERSVLDSPLGQESRGSYLYDFCILNYNGYVSEISAAWVNSGLSLKKKPAERVIKMSRGDAENLEDNFTFNVLKGTYRKDYRMYYLPPDGCGHKGYLFGFDAADHKAFPVFFAEAGRK